MLRASPMVTFCHPRPKVQGPLWPITFLDQRQVIASATPKHLAE
jgi:hypothetical protein